MPGAGAPGAAAPGALRPMPPPPPQRNPPSPPVSSVAASPSVVPRASATPPPPPQRYSSSPVFARPLTQPPVAGVTTQLEQRLGTTQIELRKLGSERHTLRARLRREADRLRELESALRAEKDLRAQASDEHFAAILGLRSRLAEVEAERDAETARLRSELEQARTEVEQASVELEQVRAQPADGGAGAVVASDRVGKVPQGLRRIRGIGPAYQRVLEQAGVTRVQQIASWTEADLLAFADKLKIRPDRITKDDWIGQAKSLERDPDA
jgi:predicted flap endonuclease-1-like 5' DNA nuclease